MALKFQENGKKVACLQIKLDVIQYLSKFGRISNILWDKLSTLFFCVSILIMKKLILGLGAAVVLTGSYAGATIYSSQIAEEKIKEAVADASKYAKIGYEDVRVDLLNQNIHISDIVITPVDSEETFYINELVINDYDKKTDVATLANFSINGIKLDLTKHRDKTEKITELGYQGQLLLNVAVDFNYNMQTKALDLKNFTLGIDDMGDITINFKLHELNLKSGTVFGALMNPKFSLQNAEIRYHDDSLAERLFKLAAKKENVSVETYKKLGIEKIQQLVDAEQDTFTKTALEQIIVFIEKPKSFSVSASPESPFLLGRLMMIKNPKDLIKQLNVKIKS